MVSRADIAHFSRFGYAVLRRAFDPEPLTDEVDRAFREGSRASFGATVGGGVVTGRYVPMMCERTPYSLSLLDQFAAVAATLLAARALPVRAKAVLYHGDTDWHHDSDLDVASIGCLCYLEPLRADNGALRVLPGSHLDDVGRSLLARPEVFRTLRGLTLDTDPGDAIVFDEHLFHASSKGQDRRQWRVDFVPDPTDAATEAVVRRYFSQLYVPGWDGGYDVARYPTYGDHWRASQRWWLARLDELGAHDAAAAEEAAVAS